MLVQQNVKVLRRKAACDVTAFKFQGTIRYFIWLHHAYSQKIDSHESLLEFRGKIHVCALCPVAGTLVRQHGSPDAMNDN